MNTVLNTLELEIYTDGVLAERNRISDLLEDIITELQLESEAASNKGEVAFSLTLQDRIAVLQEVESLVKAEV